MVGQVSVRNGKLGGRPKTGAVPSEKKLAAAAMRTARQTLTEWCQERELATIARVEWLAKHALAESIRLAANGMLLDRSRGRPHQAISATGDGSIQFMVISGVPRHDRPVDEHWIAGAINQPADADDQADKRHRDGQTYDVDDVLPREGEQPPIPTHTPSTGHTAQPRLPRALPSTPPYNRR